MKLDDDTLVLQCLNNNREAARELFVRYALFMYRLAYRSVLNQSVAEEISQEAWLKIFQNLESYNLGTSFRLWAATICHNLCVDHIRWAQKRQNIDKSAIKQLLYPTRLLPNEHAAQKEFVDKVLAFIQNMPEVFRTAFLLRYMEEMSYKEIAGIVGCTAPTARTRVFRAAESLRKQFSS